MRRFGPAMRLDKAHHHVAAFGLEALRPRQHGKGLADAGRGAEKNLELAARSRFRRASEARPERDAVRRLGHIISRCPTWRQRVERHIENEAH